MQMKRWRAEQREHGAKDAHTFCPAYNTGEYGIGGRGDQTNARIKAGNASEKKEWMREARYGAGRAPARVLLSQSETSTKW